MQQNSDLVVRQSLEVAGERWADPEARLEAQLEVWLEVRSEAQRGSFVASSEAVLLPASALPVGLVAGKLPEVHAGEVAEAHAGERNSRTGEEKAGHCLYPLQREGFVQVGMLAGLPQLLELAVEPMAVNSTGAVTP